jgi:DNA-binding Xre family transcriptional regulator
LEPEWKAVFRNRMKERAVTYSQLASALGMSLPGVKKLFQKNDINLGRFNRICQILQLDPAEALTQGMRDGLHVKSIQDAAEEFFLKERRSFQLYWLLTVEKLELDEAIREIAMEKAEAYRILGALDRFGMIRWLDGDRIVLPDAVPFLFERNTEPVTEFMREQAVKLVNEVLDQPAGDVTRPPYICLRYLSLPPVELEQLMQSIRKTLNDLWRRKPYLGRRESKAPPNAPAQILFCVSQTSKSLGRPKMN